MNIEEGSPVRCEIRLNNCELKKEGLTIANKEFKENYYNFIEKGESDVLIFDFSGTAFEAFSFPPDSMKIKMIV